MPLDKDERRDLSDEIRDVAATLQAAAIDMKREDIPFTKPYFALARSMLRLQEISREILEEYKD